MRPMAAWRETVVVATGVAVVFAVGVMAASGAGLRPLAALVAMAGAVAVILFVGWAKHKTAAKRQQGQP